MGKSIGMRRLAAAFSILCISSVPIRALATDWPQTHSDLPADPHVVFGALPNGMRYAIMRNATPKGAVAVRLGIEAGSLEESDAQQGLAHFLEHMAFRGSRHVPESEVWPGLARLGLSVGADANASTAWTQTLYQFNLPRNDEATVDAGLMRLREVASELTLAQRAMNDERGVILSEERLRDTPQFRQSKALLGELFPGSLIPQRMPIGLTDIIKNAPVSLIRDFYSHYYRPERATVIVVGDIDPKAIEAKIKTRFGDWKPVGPAGEDPRLAPPGPRGPQIGLFVEPGAPSVLSLTWLKPTQPDTLERERADFAELVGMKILEYRLRDLASGPQHPFAAVQGSRDIAFHDAVIASAQMVIRPQNWRIALAAAVTAERRLDQFGVTADEVARAQAEIHALLQNLVAQEETRPSPEVADAIAQAVDQGEVFSDPAEELSLADDVFKSLTPAKVDAAIRGAMHEHGPVIQLSSPDPVKGGLETVTAALAAAEKAPLPAEAAQAKVVWPYTSFGPAGHVADRKTIADLNATFVHFANGVRLTVKPTTFSIGQVVVDVRIGDGRAGLPPHQDSPIWAVPLGFVQGGLKAIGYDNMARVLAGKVLGVEASMENNGLILWGHTRPADLSTLMQVMTAYVSEPGWRPEGLDQARGQMADEIAQAASSPIGVLRRDAGLLLHDGDQRWAVPSAAEVAGLTPQAFQGMLAPILASAPIEITMAGDITPEAAIQAVTDTFGALPSRAAATAPSASGLAIHFPAATPTPVILHHAGRADQGVAAEAWPTDDAYHMRMAAALKVLSRVISTRVMDQLRIKDGATYSPDVESQGSTVFPGYGFLLAATELPQEKMPLFFSTLGAIVADLKTKPIDTDELERARKPLLEDLLQRQQKNQYWANVLLGAQLDSRHLELIRGAVSDMKQVDAAGIERAAATYLSKAKAWEVEVTPAPAAH